MKVYLAGPIQGCSDSEAKEWRALAASLIDDVLDPMVRDYRGVEGENVEAIVEGDKADIDNCEALLAYCPRPSVGTSMEVLYAWQSGMLAVAVVPAGAPISPWLRYHSNVIVSSVEDAAKELEKLA